MTFQSKLKHILRWHCKAEVSRQIGLAPGTIWNIINGKQMPRMGTVQKIAAVLGIEVAWLIDDSRGLPEVRTKRRKIGRPLEIDPTPLDPALTNRFGTDAAKNSSDTTAA